MKRVVFIVLWTAIFAVLIFITWQLTWDWLVRAGIVTVWAEHFAVLILWICYSICVAVTLLGLILGLFGKLPGTKLAKTQT